MLGGFPFADVNASVKLPSLASYLGLFKPVTRARWDWWSPLAMAGLGAFGVAFIYSAQLQAHGTDWMKQLVFLALGAAIYAAVAENARQWTLPDQVLVGVIEDRLQSSAKHP